MTFNVYVDLPRELTAIERTRMGEALNSCIPDGGCVGLQSGPNDEVYFAVNAKSHDDAHRMAENYMLALLETSRLSMEFTIELRRSSV